MLAEMNDRSNEDIEKRILAVFVIRYCKGLGGARIHSSTSWDSMCGCLYM